MTDLEIEQFRIELNTKINTFCDQLKEENNKSKPKKVSIEERSFDIKELEILRTRVEKEFNIKGFLLPGAKNLSKARAVFCQVAKKINTNFTVSDIARVAYGNVNCSSTVIDKLRTFFPENITDEFQIQSYINVLSMYNLRDVIFENILLKKVSKDYIDLGFKKGAKFLTLHNRCKLKCKHVGINKTHEFIVKLPKSRIIEYVDTINNEDIFRIPQGRQDIAIDKNTRIKVPKKGVLCPSYGMKVSPMDLEEIV